MLLSGRGEPGPGGLFFLIPYIGLADIVPSLHASGKVFLPDPRAVDKWWPNPSKTKDIGPIY